MANRHTETAAAALELAAIIIEETGREPAALVRDSGPIAKLMETAAKLRRAYADECNEPDTDPARSEMLERKAEELAREIGITIKFNGDPRGPAVYVQTPKSGRYNTLGGRETGWGI